MQLEINDAIQFEAALERVSPSTQEALVRLRNGTKGFSFVNPDVDLNRQAPMGVTFELTDQDLNEFGTEPPMILRGYVRRLGISEDNSDDIGFFWLRNWSVRRDDRQSVERLKESPRFVEESRDDNHSNSFHADIGTLFLRTERSNAIPVQEKGRINTTQLILPEIVIPEILQSALVKREFGPWWYTIIENLANNLAYQGSQKEKLKDILGELEATVPPSISTPKILGQLLQIFSELSIPAKLKDKAELAIGIVNAGRDWKIVDNFIAKHPEYATELPSSLPSVGNIGHWNNKRLAHRSKGPAKPGSLRDPAIFYGFDSSQKEIYV